MAKDLGERKAAWAAKMGARGQGTGGVPRSTERLPPGQKLAEGFPVLDLGIHPEVPEDEWSLTIGGEVEHSLTLDLPAFKTLPRIESTSDFHCVTTWSTYDLKWGGVRFSEVVERVLPREGAHFVFLTSYDGYSTNLALSDLLGEDVLLADTLDGKPLSLKHGGPLRLVIPHLYAWKAAKFLRTITFQKEDTPGYWEKRGYSTTADPWTNDRFLKGDA